VVASYECHGAVNHVPQVSDLFVASGFRD
jgi:hypothetical protein